MADQELLVVVRMRDEASAVLDKFAAAVGKQGRALGDATKAADAFAAAIGKIGTANTNALGPTNNLIGALGNLNTALNGQAGALQQTATGATAAKNAFATLSATILSATSNGSTITNMANAGLQLGRNLGTATTAAQTFGGAVGRIVAAGGPLAGQLGAIATAAGPLASSLGAVVVAYVQLVDAAEPLVAKQDELMRRLSTVAGGSSEAEAFFKGIKDYADKAGISIDAAKEKAIQFAKAGSKIGISAGNTLGVAVTAEQLTQISGASPQDAEAANKALQSALSSTKVEAADLKTILGSVPQIAEQIALGLRVSVGELRQMAEAGTLTGRQVFEALRTQSGEINQSFEKLPQSVAQSKQRIANAIDDLTTRFAQWLPGVRLYQQAWAAVADAVQAVSTASFLDDNAEYLKKAIAKQKAYVDDLKAQNTAFTRNQLPGAERALKNLEERLAEIGRQNKAAFDKDAAEKFKGTVIELDAALGKMGYAFDAKTGKFVEIAARDADARVAHSTKTRDSMRSELDALAAQSDGSIASLERIADARDALAKAEFVLAKAIEAASVATAERRATVEAARRSEQEAKQAEAAEIKKSAGLTQFAIEGLSDAITRMGTASNDVKSILFGTADWLKSNTSKIAQSMISDPFGWRGLPSDPNKPKDSPATSGGFGGTGDALKSLRDEVARLDGTLKALPQGPYAVRKAEMDSRASGVGSAEADLVRQTFGQREEIASTTAIDNLKKETDLLRQLAAAVGDVNKQNQIRRDFENARKLLDVAPADRERLAQAQRDKDEADKQRQEAETAYKTEQDKVEKATAFARETFKGFFSDLKDGLKKGQGLWEAFGNAARNALNKITEKIVDLVSNKLLDQLFDGLGNVLGGSGGGKGGAAGGGGGIMGAIGQGLRWIATALFADGGIMTSRGPVPLRRYAGGGIATSPQLALFGEGSVPEAYVPVPSGRIPVELRGGGLRGGLSGGMTVQTNISVNMTAPAGGQGSGGSDGRGNMMEQARELGAIVTAMVNKNLQDQMRPGGLLNPSGSFSAGVMQ